MMKEDIASALLEQAMKTPEVVDDLWHAQHGAPDDPHGMTACLRLDKLLGGTGQPDSDIAVELSYSASDYIQFLMNPSAYPAALRSQADRHFGPLMAPPKWKIPHGFRQDKGIVRWIDRVVNKHVEGKIRRGGPSATVIIITRPTPTRLLYPWQQAISANQALKVWNPTTMRPMLSNTSSAYVCVGPTKAYRVCFCRGQLQCAKVPVPVGQRMEQVFELQTLSLDKDMTVFEQFLAGLS